MFGVKLRPVSVSLRNEVERLYGKQVAENGPCLMPPHLEAVNCVTQDGTPVVRVNPRYAITEELIVHELFHLKLTAEGFPVLALDVLTTPPAARPALEYVVGQTYDAIEHWIYYPQIRRMGIDPVVRLRRDVNRVMQVGYRSGDAWDRQVINYYQPALLLEDAALLARYTRWYERQGYHGQLALGRKMDGRVRAHNPTVPDQAVAALLDCLNEFRPGGGRFVIQQDLRRATGNRTERYLTLQYVLNGPAAHSPLKIF